MSIDEQYPDDDQAPERPAPSNPFDEPDSDANPDSLIQSKRTAAISGTLIGLLLAVLVAGICILGAIAFAD